MALKGLTNSKKIINIINKYGHSCSYTVLEELETEATFGSAQQNFVCPEGIIRSKNLCTGVAYDNFDRFVDTSSGKDTLHDTVGIIFQDISNFNESNSNNVIMNVAEESDNTPQELNEIREEINEAPQQHQQELNETTDEINEAPQQHQPLGITRRRRRTFDAVTFEIESYNKRPKLRETLEPITSSLRLQIPTYISKFEHIDLAWILRHFIDKPRIPSWVGFNSIFHESTSCKQKIAYLTTINSSPTNSSVVLETMKQAQQIALECKEPYMEITYDLAIAKVALQIKSTEKPRFDNLFIHFGSFHIMMAYFKAVGKFIDNCGISDLMVNCGLLASGSVNSFITGKHFNRCKRLHPLLSLSLQILHFERFIDEKKIQISDNIKETLPDFVTKKTADPTIVDKN
ncbi:unnamed protein product, partial [Brenthis ino]